MIVTTLFSIIEGCGLMGGVTLIAFWIIVKRAACVEENVSGTKKVEGSSVQVSAISVARACLARVSSWRLAASCRFFLLIVNFCQSVQER